MEKLRTEIRAAFEKEQSAHPPIAALRHNVVEAVTAKPRREPYYQWVALAAALVIGALVVVGLVSTRLAHRAPAPANPRADYGPPPAGVPLIYVHDPAHATWLIGYDWSGQPRGTVKPNLPAGSLGRIEMSPDGQQFQAIYGGKGDTGTYLDRLGQPLSDGTPAGIGGMWADDNRHVCLVALDQAAYTWTLVTQLPGEAKRSVAVIARDQGIGQTGIRLASCSFGNDQAIAVRTSIAWPSELWVIRLSDGKVLAHHTFQRNLASVLASRDGKYIAENSDRSSGQGATSTIIRRVSDWQQVVALDPTINVMAYSSDDSLVLASTGVDLNTAPAHLAVIRWQNGSRIWTYGGTKADLRVIADPNGGGFALGLGELNVDIPLYDVLIVHGDGTEAAIPGRYRLAWWIY